MLSKKTRDKTTVIKRRKIERIILNNNKRKTHNKKKAKDNIKPGSIAVSFAANELITKFLSGILFDVLYVLSIFGVFFYNAQMEVNHTIDDFGRFEFYSEKKIITDSSLHDYLCSIQLAVYGSDNKRHIYSAYNYSEFVYYTMGGIIGVQIILFAAALISVPVKINRKLKPLYTMTDAARVLNYVDLTGDEFSTLQDAINKFSPNDSDSKIHTGKKELIGMEDAINDLLERMRNSYNSQIRFVSDASHELRTPIAVIQGYANMLDRWGREDKEVLDEAISSIKSEAENMNRLVENLLFLARGDSGRTVLRFESLNINELMCDIYDEFVMIDTNHDFILDLRADISAQADSALLKQCLRILVDNATKYSPPGTDIILRLQKRDDLSYAIEVQDYGIGIKKEDADKIFERFYRSDPARTRQNGGSGLGLSIAKWIADKHNAFFELLSYENLGTRISLIMPFVIKPDENTD